MGLFGMVGWLLGVPPVEQREARKARREEIWNVRTEIGKILDKKLSEVQGESEDYLINDINGWDLKCSLPNEFFFYNNPYIDVICNKFIEDFANEYNDINIDKKREDMPKVVEYYEPEWKYKKGKKEWKGFNRVKVEFDSLSESEKKKVIKIYNQQQVVNKHRKIWGTPKTVEDISKIIEEVEKKEELKKLQVINGDIDKQIELLKLQKEILELKEKQQEGIDKE